MSSVSGRSRITAQRFDGTFYNGLSSDTVVELTIGIAALGQRDTIGRLYRVPTNVPPLGTQQVSFPILEDPAAQREWTIVEAKVTETDEQKCYEHLISSFSGQ